jgi:hypothetical protein
MDAHDRAALQLAVETMRADPEQRELIEHVRSKRSEQAAALWAVGFLQTKNLHLKPWEAPPCDSSSEVLSDNYGSRQGEGALLRRMLALGLSRYEADPLKAIERIERERAA